MVLILALNHTCSYGRLTSMVSVLVRPWFAGLRAQESSQFNTAVQSILHEEANVNQNLAVPWLLEPPCSKFKETPNPFVLILRLFYWKA